MTDIPDYHTTPVQAGELAQAAGARHLLLYHIVPPLPVPGLEGVFLDGVSEVFSGGITLGPRRHADLAAEPVEGGRSRSSRECAMIQTRSGGNRSER